MKKEIIEWIGGYPRVVEVEEPDLNEKILEDIKWEQESGLKGWALTKAFINRLFNREEE